MQKQGIVFILVLLLLSTFVMAAKDPYDAFDNFKTTKVGFLVAGSDTTNEPSDAYGIAWYRYFVSAGFNVVKVETSRVSGATYDGSNNFSTLAFLVIPYTADFSDITTIDTSVANGIGDVEIVLMHHGASIVDSLGFPAMAQVTSVDSFRFGGDTTSFPINYCSRRGYTTTSYSPNIYGIPKADSLLVKNNLVWASHNTIDTLVVAAYDTINVKRLFFSGSSIYPYEYVDYYGTTERSNGWASHDPLTALNRSISLILGTNTDSLFHFAGHGGEDYGLIGVDPFKNWLEMNGHRVDKADVAEDNGFNNYSDSSTYDGTNDWGTPDAFYFANDAFGATQLNEDTLDANNTKGFGFGIQVNDYFGLFTNNLGAVSNDTLIAPNASHLFLTGGVGLNDTLNVMSGGTWARSFQNTATLTTIYELEAVGTRYPIVVEEKGTKKVGILHSGANEYYTNTYARLWNNDMWNLIADAFGYLFVSGLDAPTNFALTAISTDSIRATWTDNATGENSYALYIYDDGNSTDYWFDQSIAANSEADTIRPLWPPNTRVIADVAVCSAAGDTVFSGTRDTAYTNAAVPPTPELEALSDSTIKLIINGKLDDNEFSDTSATGFTANSGTWDVLYPDLVMENETAAGGEVYKAYSSEVRDVEWRMTYSFSDTILFSSQNIIYHIWQNQSALGDDGYNVFCESDSIFFRRSDNGTHTNLVSAKVTDAENSHWHDVKVTRRWQSGPNDTTCTWTLYFDGTSQGTSTDVTYTSGITHIGFEVNKAGIHFDNVFIRGLWPSGNHFSTTYAVQEATLGTYVTATNNPSTLGTITWHTYATFDSTQGDTVAGLSPNTSYSFRTKALSGW